MDYLLTGFLVLTTVVSLATCGFSLYCLWKLVQEIWAQ